MRFLDGFAFGVEHQQEMKGVVAQVVASAFLLVSPQVTHLELDALADVAPQAGIDPALLKPRNGRSQISNAIEGRKLG